MAAKTARQRRAEAWAAVDAMTNAQRAAEGIATIYPRDRSERGYADDADADCPCGGVHACNLRVIWRDGDLTKCCTRGMESSGEWAEQMPGGFAEWTIR